MPKKVVYNSIAVYGDTVVYKQICYFYTSTMTHEDINQMFCKWNNILFGLWNYCLLEIIKLDTFPDEHEEYPRIYS